MELRGARTRPWRPPLESEFASSHRKERDAQPPPLAAVAGGYRGRRRRRLALPIPRARQCLLQRPRVRSLRRRALLQSKRRAAKGARSLSQMAVGRAWRAVAEEISQPIPNG